MRFIGRFWMEESPVSVVSKVWPLKMPEISRVVVPELPASNTSEGADSPCKPFPCTKMRSGVFSISMPSFWKQLIVERQSAPCKKFVTSVVPCAIAPNITLRWEIDLSPGTVTSPRSALLAVSSIIPLKSFPFINFFRYALHSRVCSAAESPL